MKVWLEVDDNNDRWMMTRWDSGGIPKKRGNDKREIKEIGEKATE
jgi:hypothetical protein